MPGLWAFRSRSKQCEQCYCNNKLKQLDYLGGRSYYISAATLEQELGNLWYVVATKPQPYSNSARITFIAVTVKLRQPTGQSQDNFNFGLSLLKF